MFQCPFEKLRVCVCVGGGFVFLYGYQKRCPLFRSSISHGLGEGQKSFVFVKREFGRKHLSVLCNSPRSFSSCLVPWTPERQHLGGSRTLRGVGWVEGGWRGGDLAQGPQHREPIRRDIPPLQSLTWQQRCGMKDLISVCRAAPPPNTHKHKHKRGRRSPTTATSSLVMLVGVACVFRGRLDGNGLLDGAVLKAGKQ